VGTTVQVEQGRWSFLDARLLNAGSPVNNVLDRQIKVAYKKYGAYSFLVKPINDAQTLLKGGGAAIGATTITVEDSSIFPRTTGTLVIDAGGAPEMIDFTSNNSATPGTLTVPSGITATHVADVTVDFSYTTELTSDALTGATKLYVEDTSLFPPDFGMIKIFNVSSSEVIEISSVLTATKEITLATPLTAVAGFSAGDKVALVEWYEVDTNSPGGYYSLLLSPTELSALDSFLYTIDVYSLAAVPAVFGEFDRTVDVIKATSAETESPPTLSTCILKDNIVDLAGNPVQNISVSARMLSVPRIAQGAGVEDLVVTSTTDANGFFQLTVLQGATVDIVIPKVGYRRTLVVPGTTSANLFEV
jgi:hypothetical protein